jgi:hypothetical protein
MMTSYLRRKRVLTRDASSPEFGQWLFMSLMALVLLSAFPIMGSANDSYIVGVVFLDANENGSYDSGESVQSGHNVYLEDLTLTNAGQGGNFHATTNADGEFSFIAQSIGDYNISTDLNDMQLTTPVVADGVMPPHKISVTENGQTALINFGLSNGTTEPPDDTSGKITGLFADQILHIDCNGNVDDQSEQKRSVENQGVTFVGGDRKKHPNMACFFGGDDYLKIANSTDTLSNFTISAWVSVFGNDTETNRAIVSNYDGGGNAQHYGVNMTKGVPALFYDDGVKLNGAKDTGTSLVDEKWHHVTAVFEGGVNAKLYVDGEPKRQTSGTMPASISPTGDLYIGRGGDSEAMEKRWRGSLDEIRIIKRVLSEDEITKLATVIDLPTGETFVPTDPTGEVDDAPFFFNAKSDDDKGVIESLKVTPNSDGSFSLNTVSYDSNTRRNVRDGTSNTTLVIKDGEMTLLDETQPGVITKVNIAGDLEITDEATPDLKLLLLNGREQFAFQSISNPSLFAGVNADGSLDIIDTNYPNIKAVRGGKGTNGNIYVVDEETGTQAVIYPDGKTVASHPDYPNIEIDFNAFDTEENYTVTNTLTGEVECITAAELEANPNIRRNVRGLFSSIGKVFKKGLSSIGKFARGAVGFVGKVVKGAGKLVRSAGKGIAKIGKFIGTGVRKIFGGIKNFFSNIFGGSKKLKKTIKKLQGQVSALQGQVHTLQATVQAQAKTIDDLKEHILKQDEIIAELRAIIVQNAETIRQQAETIAELKNTVEQQKQIIESQATMITALEQRIADLETRTRSGEGGVDEIPDGDDISDGGRRRGSLRDGTSNECRPSITPASCQVYGVQDQGPNDSISFVYNPVDQTVEQIGETCQGCDLEAMAIHPVTDEIYLGSGDNANGHPNGHLYKLDANTGALRSVGITGFNDISGLTFDDNGILWGWAKGQGLVTLDTEIGKGILVFSSSLPLADLSWDSNYQVLYGVLAKKLWSYDPISSAIIELCDNLPRKTEAVKALPVDVSQAGLVWIGSHNNEKTELQAFEIATCQFRKDLNLSIGYDDVEGIAMPTAACQ